MIRLRRKKREKFGTRDQDGPVRCDAHLQWIRGMECTVHDADCSGRIEAAHVRIGTDGGTGMKPGDDWTVPLCAFHHGEQHQRGERTFWGRAGVNPRNVARMLWAVSPAGKRYRREREGAE